MKKLAVLFAALLATPALAAKPMPPMEREFSADMVLTRAGGPPQTHRLYVSHRKARAEMSMHGRQTVVIHDLAAGRTWMLYPEQKTAMEMPGAGAGMAGRPGGQQAPLADLLAGPGENPCSRLKDFTCAKLGTDTVNGRATTKWQVTDPQGRQATDWVDRDLHLVIKRQSQDSTLEMRNIKEGNQPADLFEVPSDYKVTQMGGPGMMPPGGMPPGHMPPGGMPPGGMPHAGPPPQGTQQ